MWVSRGISSVPEKLQRIAPLIRILVYKPQNLPHEGYAQIKKLKRQDDATLKWSTPEVIQAGVIASHFITLSGLVKALGLNQEVTHRFVSMSVTDRC